MALKHLKMHLQCFQSNKTTNHSSFSEYEAGWFTLMDWTYHTDQVYVGKIFIKKYIKKGECFSQHCKVIFHPSWWNTCTCFQWSQRRQSSCFAKGMDAFFLSKNHCCSCTWWIKLQQRLSFHRDGCGGGTVPESSMWECCFIWGFGIWCVSPLWIDQSFGKTCWIKKAHRNASHLQITSACMKSIQPPTNWIVKKVEIRKCHLWNLFDKGSAHGNGYSQLWAGILNLLQFLDQRIFHSQELFDIISCMPDGPFLVWKDDSVIIPITCYLPVCEVRYE